MDKVIGLGGVFFKSKDPKALNAWYKKHLGVPAEDWGAMFDIQKVKEKAPGAYNVWSPFKDTTEYIRPSTKDFMFNFIVADLHKLLEELKAEGIEQAGEPQESEYGKFGWILDPEGNKIELWEPPVS
jgi:predicted enzyme related to lactoylglutathione lyase